MIWGKEDWNKELGKKDCDVQDEVEVILTHQPKTSGKVDMGFEKWLEDWFENNINSNSNNMNPEFESARDAWFSQLDADELIEFGNEFAHEIALEENVAGRHELALEIKPDIDFSKDWLSQLKK